METRIIETPFEKFKVEIKTYLTAEDELAIQKVLYDATEVKEGGVGGISGSTGDVMINMEKKLMEVAVISINGEKEKIVEKLMKMSAQDYDIVKTEVDKIRDYVRVKKK